MSFRSDAKEITQGIISALGETFAFTPMGGSAVNITGSFYSEYIDQLDKSSMMPTMSVVSSDADFSIGGVFVVDGLNYRIVVTEPDEDGMTRNILEKF